MRIIIILLLLCVQPFLAARATKRQFKVLIAADTTTKNIRRGSVADLDRMKQSLRSIAAQTGLRLRLTVLQRDRLTSERINAWVQSLSSSDISFCYYTGHGVRVAPSVDPWPCLALPVNNEGLTKAIPGSALLLAIKKRHPRLAIVFLDCCNRPVITKAISKTDFNKELIIKKKPALPGLKTLFLKSKGLIASCAATKGEAALTVVKGTPLGGGFTTGFLATLKHVGHKPSISWASVLETTSGLCARLSNDKQHPIYSKCSIS